MAMIYANDDVESLMKEHPESAGLFDHYVAGMVDNIDWQDASTDFESELNNVFYKATDEAAQFNQGKSSLASNFILGLLDPKNVDMARASANIAAITQDLLLKAYSNMSKYMSKDTVSSLWGSILNEKDADAA